MNEFSPAKTLYSLVFVVALLASAWSYFEYQAASSQLEERLQQLVTSQKQVEEIRRLASKPRLASLSEEQPGVTSLRIGNAAKAAGIPNPRKTTHSSPVPDTNDSNYQRRDTVIELENATLPQLIRFIETLESPEAGLSIRILDLTPASPPNASPELWKANLTLTQLIFSPKS